MGIVKDCCFFSKMEYIYVSFPPLQDAEKGTEAGSRAQLDLPYEINLDSYEVSLDFANLEGSSFVKLADTYIFLENVQTGEIRKLYLHNLDQGTPEEVQEAMSEFLPTFRLERAAERQTTKDETWVLVQGIPQGSRVRLGPALSCCFVAVLDGGRPGGALRGEWAQVQLRPGSRNGRIFSRKFDPYSSDDMQFFCASGAGSLS